jgi:hypothetical protein
VGFEGRGLGLPEVKEGLDGIDEGLGRIGEGWGGVQDGLMEGGTGCWKAGMDWGGLGRVGEGLEGGWGALGGAWEDASTHTYYGGG